MSERQASPGLRVGTFPVSRGDGEGCADQNLGPSDSQDGGCHVTRGRGTCRGDAGHRLVCVPAGGASGEFIVLLRMAHDLKLFIALLSI